MALKTRIIIAKRTLKKLYQNTFEPLVQYITLQHTSTIRTYSFLLPTTYLLACSPFKKSSLSYGLMAVNALKKPTNEGVNNKLFGSSIFEHE